MKNSLKLLLFTAILGASAMAQDAEVTPLMSKDLAESPGKEAVMISVVYPPGAKDPVHRHQAHALLYVIEGSIVMEVNGGNEVTLTPGQTFYEGPSDIHTVGRNASATKRAKFIVVLVKDKVAPLLHPISPTPAILSASPKS